jgi:HNH endonuclease
MYCFDFLSACRSISAIGAVHCLPGDTLDSDGYWAWMDAQLKQRKRASGGESCLVCAGPIPASAHWKHRDRHVCSSHCNQLLIRRWKRRIARGEAEAFAPSDECVTVANLAAARQPRVMRTLPPEAPFPYEYERFPVAGDILERHGHHTVYMPIAELPYGGTFVERVMKDAGYPPEQTLGVVHAESGGWTSMFVDAKGVPTRLHLGQVIFGDHMVSSHEPIQMTTEYTDAPVMIYCNFELFRCVDEEGCDYTWEALSFSPARIGVGLWTPEFTQRSEKRARINRATSAYRARMKALGVDDPEADPIDPHDIYVRDGWKCCICGGRVDSSRSWPDPWVATLDHVRPVSRGGTHTQDNLATAHWVCNLIKGNS